MKSVPNYTEIYPYADEFEGQNAVLGKVGKSSCHYKPTIEVNLMYINKMYLSNMFIVISESGWKYQ